MAYFALCIFVSAFLIFQIQPMIARYILPWFGGAPAVWSTVMLFFQVLLTGGYAYAYWLIRQARNKTVFHLVLVGISLLVILALGLVWKSPITPDPSWKPAGTEFPIWEIFKLLFISVGLPYFLLSTNSPLMQAWFHRAYPYSSAYRLYALSNIGSLLGLVTYPLLIEPNLTLAWQGRIWSLLYVMYAGLAAFGAVKFLRSHAPARELEEAENVLAGGLAPGVRPTAKHYLLWIGLAATASLLLLATTSQVTQEVAVIPFLWVLPLTVYLLSFIFAFSGEKWYSRQAYLVIFFISTLLVGWALGRSESLGLWIQIGIYTVALFAACMVCHGELYRLRPAPEHLTYFYLMVSVGGALGGILINFVAPTVFLGYWEYPLGFVLCWCLFLWVHFLKRIATKRRWQFILNSALLISAMLVSSVRLVQQVRSDLTSSLLIERNYYSVLRVKLLNAEAGAVREYILVHGVTIHGIQLADADERDLPTAYYSETGGGGLALLNHPDRGRGMRVGVLGLGIGTLAAYGQPGDVYRFYEINPQVIQLAEGRGDYFSFLADSRADIEVVLGDARLSLERELAATGSDRFDVLVLDVFSGDSIPVHLLDKEAFDLYLQHLEPDGILAVHISNRHLDLIPVVWGLADYFGLSRVVIDDQGNGETGFHSLWMLLAPEATLLENPAIAGRATPMHGYVPGIPLWTDDYSNLIQILR